MRKHILFLKGLFLLFFLPSISFSQLNLTGFETTGFVNLSSNVYSTNLPQNRFESGLTNLIGGITFKNNLVEIPFKFYLSNQEKKIQQPFNQLGISPVFWGWLKVNAGYFNTKVSDFTYGESKMLGGGIETVNLPIRFGFNYGRIQQSIEPDTSARFYGKFARDAWSFKLGYGSDKSYIDFNLFKAKDDETSLSKIIYPASPRENAVMSFSFVLPYLEQDLNCYGEIATSIYTSDTRVQDNTEEGFYDVLKPLIKLKYTSRFDGAIKFGLNYKIDKSMTLGYEGNWIGPGFTTLGYEYLQNDLFDNKLTGTFKLLNNKLNIRGNLGIRSNNLRNNKFATTNRFISSLVTSYQISNLFGFDVNFMNYGMKSDPANDSVRVDNISNYISVSPRFNFMNFGAMNNLTFLYSYQNLENLNIISFNRTNVRSHNILGTWNLFFKSGLNLNTSLNYTDTRLNDIGNKFTNISISASNNFLENKLYASVNLGFYIMNSFDENNQFNGGLNLRYSLNKFGTVSAYVIRNMYNSNFNPSINEWLANIQYNYNF